MWKVNTSFMSSTDKKKYFFILKPGLLTGSLPFQIEKKDRDALEEHDDQLPIIGNKQLELVKEGFLTSRKLLEDKSHSVVTIISFMNLSSSTIKLSPPAMTSRYPSEKNPWPKEVPTLSLINLLSRKANYSAKGCVGATIFKLSKTLHILFYFFFILKGFLFF